MKFTTTTVIFLIVLHQTSGASIQPDIVENSSIRYAAGASEPKESTNEAKLPLRQSSGPQLEGAPVTTNASVPNKATLNLIGKVISNMRNKSAGTKHPTKQFLGGKFPPFLERIVQRIQNYFSVYNPPEYFESNRPPVTSNEGISIVCSNGENDSLSCNPASESEYEEDCEQSTAASQVSLNGAQPPVADDDGGYNVVVTHTVVHDNMINVYSPAGDPVNGQFVSNVVVILEPSSSEVKASTESTTARNKFYVYVNPTKANKNKNNVKTKLNGESNEKPESFQPYNNSTYTVFIRGDKLEEYSNNIDNADNTSLNPDISFYVQNLTASKFVKNKCNPQARGDCEPKAVPVTDTENTILNSRSVPEDKSSSVEIPNINLVLVPPDAQKNKSCTKNKYDTADTNTNVEYYILKPDDGSLSSKPKKANGTATNFYFLSKTKLDNISPTYLPPDDTDDAPSDEHSVTSSYVMPVHVNYTSTNKPPFLLSLFKRRYEEPR